MAGDPTSTFPYNCVVLIESPDPSEAGYYLIGSGVVIGPHTILTAAHVVYDVSNGVADQNIDLYPGWNGADPALGPGNISTTYKDHFNPIAANPDGDLYQWQSASDYAVIDTSYTFSSWMGVVLNYPGGTVHVTGYPANAGGYQTDETGTVSADPNYSVLDYGTLSVSPGNSGGPLWLDDNGSDDVAGVVSTTGWACQLTTADWSQIEAWVSEDGYSVGTTPSYIAPAVAAASTVSVREGQSIPASSLIASISNPSRDAITEDLYADLGGGSGYFTVNGVRQADGVWFSASPGADVDYIGGPSPGSDTLEVGIYDSTTNSSIYASNPVVATTMPGGGTSPAPATDILFQNADGRVATWDMSGLNVIGGGTVSLDPGPSWQAIGTGDFSGADQSDILFQNTSSGRVAIWDLSGTEVTGGGTVGPDPGPSWRAIGTGGFSGGDHSDILFQNASSGQVAIWDMSGTNITGGGAVGPDPGPQWQAIGTGDFNDDGHSDILFQDPSSGQIAIWEMDGTNIVGGGVVGPDPGPQWQAIGTGDFNDDGHADVLFQSPGSGQIAIWEMNGLNAIGGGTVSADPGPSWRAIGTDGGGADILFQSANGQTAIWDMNGTNIAGGGAVSLNPGSSWRAVGLT